MRLLLLAIFTIVPCYPLLSQSIFSEFNQLPQEFNQLSQEPLVDGSFYFDIPSGTGLYEEPGMGLSNGSILLGIPLLTLVPHRAENSLIIHNDGPVLGSNGYRTLFRWADHWNIDIQISGQPWVQWGFGQLNVFAPSEDTPQYAAQWNITSDYGDGHQQALVDLYQRLQREEAAKGGPALLFSWSDQHFLIDATLLSGLSLVIPGVSLLFLALYINRGPRTKVSSFVRIGASATLPILAMVFSAGLVMALVRLAIAQGLWSSFSTISAWFAMAGLGTLLLYPIGSQIRARRKRALYPLLRQGALNLFALGIVVSATLHLTIGLILSLAFGGLSLAHRSRAMVIRILGAFFSLAMLYLLGREIVIAAPRLTIGIDDNRGIFIGALVLATIVVSSSAIFVFNYPLIRRSWFLVALGVVVVAMAYGPTEGSLDSNLTSLIHYPQYQRHYWHPQEPNGAELRSLQTLTIADPRLERQSFFDRWTVPVQFGPEIERWTMYVHGSSPFPVFTTGEGRQLLEQDLLKIEGTSSGDISFETFPDGYGTIQLSFFGSEGENWIEETRFELVWSSRNE